MIVIEKLIIRECLVRTLMVLTGVIALFIVFDILDSARSALSNDRSLSYFFLKTLLDIPARFYELLPLAVLLGSIWAISLMAKSSELTVMRVSGYLIKRLLVLLFLFGMGCGLLGTFIDEVVDRFAYQQKQSLLAKKNTEIRENLWIRYHKNFIHFDKVSKNKVNGVTSIKISDDFTNIESIVTAKSGEYKPIEGLASQKPVWLLSEVEETLFNFSNINNQTHLNKNKNSNIDKTKKIFTHEHIAKLVAFSNSQKSIYQKSYYTHKIWDGAPKTDLLVGQDTNPVKLKLTQLIPLYQFNLDNLLRFEALAVNMWKKIAYPLVVALMAMIGIPFCLKTGRQVEASFRILIGILLGITFFVIQGIFANLGVLALPPFIGVLFPIILFSLLTLFGVWWAQKR